MGVDHYPLRAKVAEEVLQMIRDEIGNPTWVPRGVLTGGGWAYGSEVRERMRQIWREERKVWKRNRSPG
jgi:hypothetical protein